MPASEHFFVLPIVAARDGQPYIQLSNEHGQIAQLTMAQARNIAHDILVGCSRAEADAMIIRFFERSEFPKNAAGALLIDFRNFRAELDAEVVSRSQEDPDKLPGQENPPQE